MSLIDKLGTYRKPARTARGRHAQRIRRRERRREGRLFPRTGEKSENPPLAAASPCRRDCHSRPAPVMRKGARHSVRMSPSWRLALPFRPHVAREPQPRSRHARMPTTLGTVTTPQKNSVVRARVSCGPFLPFTASPLLPPRREHRDHKGAFSNRGFRARTFYSYGECSLVLPCSLSAVPADGSQKRHFAF
jgi:hypothetical protein